MLARGRFSLPLLLLLLACSGPREQAADSSTAPPDLPRGLLIALAQFVEGDTPGQLTAPGAARLEMLVRRGGRWELEALEDPRSNVLHKALMYESPDGGQGILTAAGTQARLELWRHGAGGWSSTTLWEVDFGGRFSRCRDVECADLFGDGPWDLAVATHDQGVVAVLRPGPEGMVVRELDRQPDTFVHEVEVGDLDGDGVREVYATPSEPNRLDGTPQPGRVVRYVPAREEGRVVVADLGERHAKEILVADVDGNGRDELYVAVEAETEGEGETLRLIKTVEIRRYEADTPAGECAVIARLPDRFCRFLTVGDVDGDGRKEMVAAAFRSGVWLLTPGENPDWPWAISALDRESGGFEHAALLTDLDGDGRDELYVASDDHHEIRRYVWETEGPPRREVILRREDPDRRVLTWNLMPFPVERLRAGS